MFMEMSSGDIHIFHTIPLGCRYHKAESVTGVLEPDNLHLKTDVSMLIKVLSIVWVFESLEMLQTYIQISQD